jgi:hypothetical protein
MGVAAPVVVAEMADWVALGGGNSGIVGNAGHTFGFHVAADELPADDYSRVLDPNGPNGPYVNWDYATAGDFSHGNDEALRGMHRALLARLMRGELPMICEFIGQPWADQPVYYWARWNGDAVLQRYTGEGHDHWSHISWYRSQVNQRAHLWTPATPTEEDTVQTYVIAQSTPGTQHYLCDGMESRPVPEGDLPHIRELAKEGVFALANGGQVRQGWFADGFGPVRTTGGGTGGGPVDLSSKALADVRAIVDQENDEQSLGGADHD